MFGGLCPFLDGLRGEHGLRRRPSLRQQQHQDLYVAVARFFSGGGFRYEDHKDAFGKPHVFVLIDGSAKHFPEPFPGAPSQLGVLCAQGLRTGLPVRQACRPRLRFPLPVRGAIAGRRRRTAGLAVRKGLVSSSLRSRRTTQSGAPTRASTMIPCGTRSGRSCRPASSTWSSAACRAALGAKLHTRRVPAHRRYAHGITRGAFHGCAGQPGHAVTPPTSSSSGASRRSVLERTSPSAARFLLEHPEDLGEVRSLFASLRLSVDGGGTTDDYVGSGLPGPLSVLLGCASA